jgi:hypothetical protein
MGARLIDELFTARAEQTVTVSAEVTLGRVIAELARAHPPDTATRE